MSWLLVDRVLKVITGNVTPTIVTVSILTEVTNDVLDAGNKRVLAISRG